MAFVRNGVNSAVSDAGVHIERVDRTRLRYSEEGRHLNIEVEPGDGLAVYLSAVHRWQPAGEGDLISDVDRVRIQNNIEDAMAVLGQRIVIC